jgi:hypothetical protein
MVRSFGNRPIALDPFREHLARPFAIHGYPISAATEAAC